MSKKEKFDYGNNNMSIKLYNKTGIDMGQDEDILEFFEQFLLDVSTNDESVDYGEKLHTKIFASNDDRTYVIGIKCNPNGSMTAELYDIESRSQLKRLIELDWKVGEYRGLRQNFSNKFFIDKDLDGFLQSVFRPTLEYLEIHTLELGSSN